MCKFEEIEGWRLSNGKTIREIKNAVHEKINLGRIYLIISILLAYMGTISMQNANDEIYSPQIYLLMYGMRR